MDKERLLELVEDCDDYRVLVEVANAMDCHYTMLIDTIEDCRDDDKIERALRFMQYYE